MTASTTTRRFNLSQIFSNAWKLVKQNACSLSVALKSAWAQAKGNGFDQINAAFGVVAQTVSEAGQKFELFFAADYDLAPGAYTLEEVEAACADVKGCLSIKGGQLLECGMAIGRAC